MKVALLTAGKDPHYALGLAPALAEAGVELEVVGNSHMEPFPGLQHPNIRFFNLRGDQQSEAGIVEKVWRVLRYYARLVRFAWRSQSTVFHILWPNKFVYFDRTILNLYYRSLGKKLVFTAHNVNTEARDRRDSALNRLSLRIHYYLMDHVFVHTQEMQNELMSLYGVRAEKVTTVRFPINNVTPRTHLTRHEARIKLGIPSEEKTILFFGNIAAYKGLDDLIRALPLLRSRIDQLRVLIVGSPKQGEEHYFVQINELIKELGVSNLIDQRIDYVPEEDVEIYFKSADLAVLPYRRIFQSGVLFLSYSFGLPVVAADAGSLRQEIIEGKTGFVAELADPVDLAGQIHRYFESDLFAELETRRGWIISYANETYSWDPLALKTRQVYESVLERSTERQVTPASNPGRD
jgi:D-inositol-3-phosphate glycosyltransferase